MIICLNMRGLFTGIQQHESCLYVILQLDAVIVGYMKEWWINVMLHLLEERKRAIDVWMNCGCMYDRIMS
jgi:hypothetical protein